MSNSLPPAIATNSGRSQRLRAALLVAVCALAAACGGGGAQRSSSLPASWDEAPDRSGPRMTRDEMVAALALPDPVRAARVVVQAHVRVDGELGRDASVVRSRTRAALESHPDLTTDLDAGRASGLSLVLLDAVTNCALGERDGRAELECTVRFSLADRRGKLVAAWKRSVTVTGRHGERVGALLDDAVDHVLLGLPEQILLTHDSTDDSTVALDDSDATPWNRR